MDIMQLGAIGELVGGIAVIGTLIFVGFQVRQATAAQRGAAVDALIEQAIGINATIASDDALARIVADGFAGNASFEPSESLRFHLVMRSIFVQIDSMRVKHEAGLVDESVWYPQRAVIDGMFRQPGIAQWWEGNADQFSPEFRSHIARERPQER